MLRRPDGSVRYFTVREAARLQTFPDDYALHGPWSEAMRQLGNAVPVRLAEVVATSVRRHLEFAAQRDRLAFGTGAVPDAGDRMSEPFNPLATESLAQSIVSRMLKADAVPLAGIPRFAGAGVYAIYYRGPFPAYDRLVQANRVKHAEVPIYVGKAVPRGARKGLSVGDSLTEAALWNRLRDHAKSIDAAHNLDLGDFEARWPR